MATQLLNVSIGLLTTLLGYVLGRVWQKLVDQVPYRRTRRLWGSLLDGELQIVVSRFTTSGFTDPAGIVGGGDALALRAITSYFASAGIKGIKVVYVDEPSLDRRKNLIVLGGPDTNSVAKAALERIATRVRVVDPGPGVPVEAHDLAGDPSHGSQSSLTSGHRRSARIQRYVAAPEIDYGIIVRAINPFNPASEILVIAGAYGYGTWGGAELISNESFLERCNGLGSSMASPQATGLRGLLKAQLGKARVWRDSASGTPDQASFECIFKVDVFDKRPHPPTVIVLRRIDPAAK